MSAAACEKIFYDKKYSFCGKQKIIKNNRICWKVKKSLNNKETSFDISHVFLLNHFILTCLKILVH